MYYTEKFLTTELEKILEETTLQTGAEIPNDCKKYIVAILASKIDQNPWQPEPSYAEAYMTVNSISSILSLADTCWFTRAVFPELGTRRGINPSYYVQLGQGCYSRVLSKVQDTTLEQMNEHFEFLADVTLKAIRNQPITLLKI